jgi:hypothetical protein
MEKPSIDIMFFKESKCLVTVRKVTDQEGDNLMKKSLTGVIAMLAGAAAGVAATGIRLSERIEEKQKKADKHMSLFLMMNQWVKVKQDGKNLSSYFEKEGYKQIAIYGMSYAGETLMEELIDSPVTVKYGIDRNAEMIFADVDIVTPDASLEPVDAVVVTAITFFEEVEEMLRQKVDCPIISLEDILYDV